MLQNTTTLRSIHKHFCHSFSVFSPLVIGLVPKIKGKTVPYNMTEQHSQHLANLVSILDFTTSLSGDHRPLDLVSQKMPTVRHCCKKGNDKCLFHLSRTPMSAGNAYVTDIAIFTQAQDTHVQSRQTKLTVIRFLKFGKVIIVRHLDMFATGTQQKWQQD